VLFEALLCSDESATLLFCDPAVVANPELKATTNPSACALPSDTKVT